MNRDLNGFEIILLCATLGPVEVRTGWGAF